jgi:hypothetical protein
MVSILTYLIIRDFDINVSTWFTENRMKPEGKTDEEKLFTSNEKEPSAKSFAKGNAQSDGNTRKTNHRSKVISGGTTRKAAADSQRSQDSFKARPRRRTLQQDIQKLNKEHAQITSDTDVIRPEGTMDELNC